MINVSDRFASPDGLWELDYSILMQRRPAPYDNLDDAGRAANSQTFLDHERAHWVQLTGTTVGAVVLTLMRSEDIALMKLFQESATDPYITKILEHKLASGRDLLELASDESANDVIAKYARQVLAYRTTRNLLLNSVVQFKDSADFNVTTINKAWADLLKTYAIHTGGETAPAVQQRGAVRHRFFQEDFEPVWVGAGEFELTTRCLFEAHALLNELGPILAHSWWGGLHQQAGSSPHSLLPDARFEISDRITNCSPVYTIALQVALQEWYADAAINTNGKLSCEAILASLPTLAACFDLAFNPAVHPICAEVPGGWMDIYPPARFLAAVNGVTKIGQLMQWPSDSQYRQYREELRVAANIDYGSVSLRSFQHPAFNKRFFAEAKLDHDPVAKLSYFDYLVCSMESSHALRNDRPLVAALPFLMKFRSPDNWIMPLEDRVYYYAPLYWIGDHYERQEWISDDIGRRIVFDVARCKILRLVASTVGPIDIGQEFPLELTSNPDFLNVVLEGITGMPGGSAILSREIACTPVDEYLPRVEADQLRDIEMRQARSALPIFSIFRSEVETRDYTRLDSYMYELCQSPFDSIGKFNVTFVGYSNDSRGIWDISEVIDYMLVLHERWPIWPWYIYIDDSLPQYNVAYLLMYVAGVGDPRFMPADRVAAWFKLVLLGLNLETDRIAEQFPNDAILAEEQNEKRTRELAEALKAIKFMRFD